MIALVAVGVFLAVTLAATSLGRLVIERPSGVRGRLERIARWDLMDAGFTQGNLLRMQRYSRLPFLQHRLQGTARAERIADDLERAGLHWSVGEYVLLCLSIGLFAVLGTVVFVPEGVLRLPAAAAAFALGIYAPRWIVKRRIRRRQAQFEAMLPEVLEMLTRSLRAGSGLMIAVEGMIEQTNGPIAEEFARLQRDIGRGLSFEEAFHGLDHRVASKDLHIAVTAILVQREVGGNLTESLGNVVGVMRERVRLRGEMKALVSRQVFSTYAMAAMPPGIVLLLWLMARPLVEPMFENSAGHIVLGIAGLLELTGFLIIKRMASSAPGI